MCCVADCNRSRKDPSTWTVCPECVEGMEDEVKPVSHPTKEFVYRVALIILFPAIVAVQGFYQWQEIWRDER